MSFSENIRTICRLRPENKIEKERGHKNCITYSTNTIKLKLNSTEDLVHEFTFHKIFGPESNQFEIYENSAEPLIKSVMEGYNGTLICYGHSSSGKTYTMEGTINDDNQKGIIPRMIDSLFNIINNTSDDIEFSVKCSFIEIYNEKILDLLDPRKSNLLIKEEKEKGIWVQDSTEIFVGSSDEIIDILKIGINNRSVADTSINERSSRSHSIFMLTVFQRNNKTESTKTGKLFLVDLAGSENQIKSKTTESVIEEVSNINKSLQNFNNIIDSLSEGKGTLTTYRNSKLTRILQDSIGGNSLTTFIFTCSISSLNAKEILSTMRFADKVKKIKNKPVINTKKSCKELTSKLNLAEEKIKNFENVVQDLQIQIENLNKVNIKSTLTSNSNIITTNSSNLSSSRCEDCGNAMAKILNQHIEIVGLIDDLERLKIEKNELENEIRIRNDEIYEQNEKLLLNDLQAKIIVDEESKNLTKIKSKIENSFLMNQRKIIESTNLRNLIEKIKFEVILVMKTVNLKYKNKDLAEEFSELENEKMNNITNSLDNAVNIVTIFDNYILKNNCLMNEVLELCKKKTGLTKYIANNPLDENFTVDEIKSDFRHKSVMESHFKNIGNNIEDKNYIKNKNIKRSKSFSFKNYKNDNQRIPEHLLFEDLNSSIFNCVEGQSISKDKLRSEFKLDIRKVLSEELNKKDLITSQRMTMLELSFQHKNLQDNFSNLQKEIVEKERQLKLSNERIQKIIENFEDKVKKSDFKLANLDKEYKEYQEKTLVDFSYKENQILDLHNKISLLEDEKFRLLHLDKDKKKFYAMELQINHITNEMQKLYQENLKIKQLIEKKDEELKLLNEKYSLLDTKLMESSILKIKLKAVDVGKKEKIYNLDQNEIGKAYTPVIKPSGQKLFQFETLNDILSKKINKIENKKDFSPNNSFNSGTTNNNSPYSKMGNSNKIMKIVKGKSGANILKIVTVHNKSSSISNAVSSNNQNYKHYNPDVSNFFNEKIDYLNYNSNNESSNQNNNNGFYSKMLNNPNVLKRSNEISAKLSLNSNQNMIKDKLNQEMKLLEEEYCDDILLKNAFSHKQYILPKKKVTNLKNSNSGLLSLFNKITKNK